ncbi:hypothetical protein CDQ91_01655 [Sphingopyxis witflariensis]|uniref:HTH-like domain-containing protein n=1 Tax=Sphingopyxis witflariensis TaxID=173675 RepID=A0A246K5L1_9SPHN|nr:hypothetical protein CDQ91_01655 [Sphingopyxis witflariensis]
MIALTRQHARDGYRRVTTLLHNAEWHVNRKRVEHLSRRKGLKGKTPGGRACIERENSRF